MGYCDAVVGLWDSYVGYCGVVANVWTSPLCALIYRSGECLRLV